VGVIAGHILLTAVEGDRDDAFTLELLAASIRADAADTGLFLELLASKLRGALPGDVEVSREGGLFRRSHPVRALIVRLGDRRFELHRHGHTVQARIALEARGITLRTDDAALDAWIEELSAALAERARASAATRAALARMLR
jgi:hypothetical protein